VPSFDDRVKTGSYPLPLDAGVLLFHLVHNFLPSFVLTALNG
jgi:hypothetical protein